MTKRVDFAIKQDITWLEYTASLGVLTANVYKNRPFFAMSWSSKQIEVIVNVIFAFKQNKWDPRFKSWMRKICVTHLHIKKLKNLFSKAQNNELLIYY